MRNTLLTILACLIPLFCEGQISKEAFERWHDNKYSMFIHFGLYSELGGVWDGKPVTRGYSEQIQSFAGIFSDWYGDTALRFDPTNFNADSIVALAKAAGMRSIVFTTKHHDGFCMFRTKTTDYNAYEATPCKRDFVKELSDACRRGGINMGLYFSLIDWHYPQAYPISSHNCDFITPQHHELTKAQVTELLTNYGPISELWFDMGSNTPAQSRELYELVHKLQPNCMVSGRLGNDQYDFSVMADNTYPEGALQTAWQTAASMFDETWSYRSWQVRGDAHVKAMEKLRSLISVVSHGGNYLLNIGPMGDGSVVPFEREVLLEIGSWLKENGDVIYGTEASPFREIPAWGTITRNGKNLNLILSGDCPEDGMIRLQVPGNRLESVEGPVKGNSQKGDVYAFALADNAFDDQTIHVIRLSFKDAIEPMIEDEAVTKNYSYSCFDYYSNYRSTVSYQWNLPKRTSYQIIYTDQEKGAALDIAAGEFPATRVTLDNGKAVKLDVKPLQWGKRYICGPGSGLFDSPSRLDVSLEKVPARGGKWQEIADDQKMFASNILESYYIMQEVVSPIDQDVLVDVGAGNGLELFLNGESMLKHLNPYRCQFREEKVLLPLRKGTNQIVLRVYNRFEKKTGFLLRQSAGQTIYKQTIKLDAGQVKECKGKTLPLTIRRADLASRHSDTELHNVRITK